MIRATKAQEQNEPLGVEYVQGDAGALDSLGEFDIAIGIHLLHYGHSLDHLNGMCESLSRNLKPGGLFLGYQVNSGIAREPHYYDKYCFNVRIPAHVKDGAPFVFSVTMGDYTSPDITAYCWGKESVETALHDAGLTDIHWMVPMPSDGGIAKHGADFWADVVRAPFELMVTCRKR